MNHQSVRECYGIRVDCSADAKALPLVDEFFGPPMTDRSADGFSPSGTRLSLEIEISDRVTDAPTAEPPHNEQVLKADPIVIDTGGSRAVIDPGGWTARVTLAAGDLTDPTVWGRWILERLFLYLVCRSERHYPLHAGALRIDGRTVLISAPTGIGKSTFSYWAAHRGAVLCGEDIMTRHLGDPTGLVWGHPRVTYLGPELIERCPELAGVPSAPVDGGRKHRLGLTDVPGLTLRSFARPEATVFLCHGEPGIRALDIDEAVERSRGDFSTAKSGTGLLAEIEADVRGVIGAGPVWELGLSLDLDASYEALRSALHEL